MYTSAGQAYDSGRKTSSSNRELEAMALFKAARQLEACQRSWDTPDRTSMLDAALKQNQRLWTFFQGELARPDHEMPLDLRVNLLRLSTFVDRRTLEIMADPAPEKLKVLIEINRHIGAGLTVAAS
jgi:flagellar protein FlaF